MMIDEYVQIMFGEDAELLTHRIVQLCGILLNVGVRAPALVELRQRQLTAKGKQNEEKG